MPGHAPDADLPVLSPAETARSERLAAEIRRRIAMAGGAIDFSAFMEAALYAPGLGYYAAGPEPFGPAGDFVTAPELGSVFARCLARQCQEIFERTGTAEVLEAGAGRGRLAADLLLELERLGAPADRYRILELSSVLRARQQEALATRVPQFAQRIEWVDRWPAPIRGVVIANELLDALPVERFRVRARDIAQLQVGVDGERFRWRERVADTTVTARVAALRLAEGYTSELGLQAEAWVSSLGSIIEHGAALLIDYGFPRAEFYHPQRSAGTLMCHFRHHSHPDPLVRVGLQDITAHVDFSAIADAARAVGLDVLGYTSQALFLLDSGLEEILTASNAQDAAAHLRLASEVNRLTSPAEMGELFKVLVVGRGIAGPLRGFAASDRAARL